MARNATEGADGAERQLRKEGHSRRQQQEELQQQMGPSQGDCPGEDGAHGVQSGNKFISINEFVGKRLAADDVERSGWWGERHRLGGGPEGLAF